MDRCRDTAPGGYGAKLAKRTVLALALAAAPTAAHANAGIGYFMVAVPFVLLALLPAILLEAGVLAPLLRLSPRRALALASIANLQSSLWGFGLAIAIDALLIWISGSMGPEPTKPGVTVMLVPLFFITWLIEYRAIARRRKELPRVSVARACGAANLLSYAAMIGLVWAVVPEHGATALRMRASEAMLSGNEAQLAVEDFYRSKGRLPQSGDEAGYPSSATRGSKRVSAVEIRDKGVVVLTLGIDDYWRVGGEIRLTPSADADKRTLNWTCSSTLPGRSLPAICRH